jgi:hypothetical protein
MWFLKCAGMTICIQFTREPVSYDEGLVFRASSQWPQAEEAFKRHASNLYVTTLERIEEGCRHRSDPAAAGQRQGHLIFFKGSDHSAPEIRNRFSPEFDPASETRREVVLSDYSRFQIR